MGVGVAQYVRSPLLGSLTPRERGEERRAAFSLQHAVDWTTVCQQFVSSLVLFFYQLICGPLLYVWSPRGCFCAFILSFLLAIYHSWWPFEGRERRGCSPSGFSSGQLLSVFSNFLFVFLFCSLCQESLPVDLSEIRTKQKLSGIQLKHNTSGASSFFKTNFDLMSTPPWIHLVTMSLLIWLFCYFILEQQNHSTVVRKDFTRQSKLC